MPQEIEAFFLYMYYFYMKKIVPQNDIVLCTLASSTEKTTDSGFVYSSNELPMYKVESIGPNVKMHLAENDIIIVNATGTKAKLGNVEYFLFSEENIMGKVEENEKQESM